MNKFRVFVKDKFDVVFDTIEKARDCRRALQQLKYKGIEIIVTQEDIDPRWMVLIYTTNKFGEKFGEKFKPLKIGAHR